MKAFLKSLRKPTIPVVSVRGAITQDSLWKLQTQLKGLKCSTAQALALVVNSSGGSATQAERMSSLIRAFSVKHKIPVYAFAEDHAMGAGYALLINSSDKVYADELSLVGQIASPSQTLNLNLQRAIEETHKITVRNITTNPASISSYSPKHGMPPQLIEVIQDQAKKSHQTFIHSIVALRGHRTKKSLKLDDDEKTSLNIFNGDTFTGTEAVSLGLIDNLGRMQQTMQELFPKAKLAFPSKLGLIAKIMLLSKYLNG